VGWACMPVLEPTRGCCPSPETRAKMHMLTQQASTTTINERRRIEKLPPIEDPIADTVFIPRPT